MRRNSNSKVRRSPHPAIRAFSLIEVMVASAIMAMGITSTIICLQLGINIYETSRTTDLAVQVIEDEAERIRLLNWSELNQLPLHEEFSAPSQFGASSAGTDRIKFYREVEDNDGNNEIKRILIRAEWESLKGSPKEKMVYMLYSKGGLYDYYYGST